MDEIKEIYNEDMKVKNDIKKSARCKKGGSATSKLGNRRMSWKEIQEKHGEVAVYKMNRFMDFNEFKAMPKDLQVEYLNTLQEKYDIGIKHISKWLFCIGDEGLQSHLRINDILKLCNVDKKRGKTGLQNFIDDISVYKKNRRFFEWCATQEESTKEKEERDICIVSSIDFEGGEIMSNIPVRNKAELMTYEQYTKMDPMERLEWVNRVVEDYDTTVTTISEVLFKKNPGTLWVYFKSHNLVDQLSHQNNVGTCEEKITRKKAFQKEVDAWRKFQGLEESTKENEERDICAEILPEVSNTLSGGITPSGTITLSQHDFIDSQPAEEYHDINFHSSYIRTGLDTEEFYKLATLFAGKKIRVNIDICVL